MDQTEVTREVGMSEDRRLDVLRAIVEDYVQTREPVGSRALVERHSLGVSSATIRNDMAALEEGGYIAIEKSFVGKIPHTVCRLTPTGRLAFKSYRRELKKLAGRLG